MAAFRNGYWTAFHWDRVPVRLHWSLLLGLAVLGGFRFAPGIWAGYFVIVLVHEMGHAVLVRRMKLDVVDIRMHALGGLCTYRGDITPYKNAVVAWGGVLGQAILFVLAQAALRLGGSSIGGIYGFQFLMVLGGPINIAIIVLNLIPMPPFDGAEAWRLFGYWMPRRRRPSGPRKSRRHPEEWGLLKRQKAERKKKAAEAEAASGNVEKAVQDALEAAKRAARDARSDGSDD